MGDDLIPAIKGSVKLKTRNSKEHLWKTEKRKLSLIIFIFFSKKKKKTPFIFQNLYNIEMI